MGKEVVIRSISGSVFILVMLAGLLVSPLLFAVLSAVMLGGMLWEYTRVTGRSRLLIAGIAYILASMAVFVWLAFRGGAFSGRILLAFFIMIWSSDVGAFCIGCTVGKKLCTRKLAPEISPNKSWAGFWGGLVFCVVAASVLKHFGLLPIPTFHCILLAVVIHCAGVCGDLLESAWKRYFGIKDSGRAIPGHGGFLDRFDSSLLAIPAGAAYLVLLNLI